MIRIGISASTARACDCVNRAAAPERVDGKL
jgi:hypothetical protein